MLGWRCHDESLLARHRTARVGARRLLTAFVAVTFVLVAPAAASAAAQPVNNLAPEVVGTPQVGERIVCGAGSWSGAVSEFRYEWLRDGIPVASGVSYQVTTVDKGHSLWCIVTALGSEGSAEAESSNSLAIPGASETPPVPTLAPEVSGTPALGNTLNCSTGGWSGHPAPSFTYQWLRDGTIIAGATANTYIVVEADQGDSLACKVTATNSAGQASALSSNTLRVPGSKPKDTMAPQVLGIEPSAVGESLTCWAGNWSGNPAPTFTYEWVRDRGLPGETLIESAMSSSFTVEPADQLHSLSCKVIATNSEGSAEAASSNSVKVAGSPPENIAPPKVSGTRAVGQTLTCAEGTWAGVPTPTYAYLWVRDQGTAQEEAVGSSRSYIVTSEDVGHSLSCDVTARNSEGDGTQASEPVVIPKGGGTPPGNIEAPRVSGTPALGETLNCAKGTWSGSPAPALSYQWLRDGSPIASTTASAYVVVKADQGHALSCKVTAINDEGVASKNSSNVLEIPGRLPENIEAPQIFGTPAVGQQLTCLPGRWDGAPPPQFTYQWLREGTSIPSATANSYTVASKDRGASISCAVTARDSAGTAEATSNSVAIPGSPPQNTASPEVVGTPAVGNALTCSPGMWSGAPTPTFTYQWLLNGADIPSATATTYTVAIADRGFVLSCRVTASNREGSESASSEGRRISGMRPEAIQAPQVSGTPAVNQRLTCLRGIWNGTPPPAFTYQWLRDGTSIASATSSTYTAELADEGHVLSCRVTATNSEGRAEAESTNGLAISPLTTPSNSRPELTVPPFASVPPTLTAAQIRAAIHVQLARAQHRVRIASLRKTGLYAFPFAAPAAGRLEVFWYQAPTEPHQPFANTKPLVLAVSTTSFASASTKTVKLRLTEAGRSLIGHSNRIALTVRGVFRPHGHPVSWLATFLLSH
jgi:fibronectin type 3 domain-containing protein